VARAGQDNGEKKLRAQLRKTREWADPECRAAAAEAAERATPPLLELAAALRGHNLAAMRKRHYFHVCNTWRLRSDVWARTRKRRRAEDAATELSLALPHPAAAPPPPLLSPPAACRDADCVALLVARDLHRPMQAVVTEAPAPRMLVASAAEPCAPLATLDMAGDLQIRQVAGLLRAGCAADAAALRAAADALSVSGDGALPAWRLGARVPLLAEGMLQRLLLVTNAWGDTQADAVAPDRGVAAHVGRALSAPERAHLDDKVAICDALQRFLATAQAALAQQRVRSGAGYLATSLAVLEMVDAFLSAVVAGSTARQQRFAASPAIRCATWRSPFVGHLLRAGFVQALGLAPADLATLLLPQSGPPPPLLPPSSVLLLLQAGQHA
jgi:hypothetical protein